MAERKKIIWGEFAERQYQKALGFYFLKDNNITASETLSNDVEHILELIAINNYLGKPIEKTNFRSIVIGCYLIIYEVTDNEIIIILFWDTRRNPEILKILLQELQ